jgi:hypothetical protein
VVAVASAIRVPGEVDAPPWTVWLSANEDTRLFRMIAELPKVSSTSPAPFCPVDFGLTWKVRSVKPGGQWADIHPQGCEYIDSSLGRLSANASKVFWPAFANLLQLPLWQVVAPICSASQTTECFKPL